jgi:hypothetical protein
MAPLSSSRFYMDLEFLRGDGVEESVYTTDVIVELCFKPYGEFLSAICWRWDIHVGTGKHYALHVALSEGISDGSEFRFRARHHPHLGKPPLQRLPSFTAAPTVCCGEILGSYDAVPCAGFSFVGTARSKHEDDPSLRGGGSECAGRAGGVGPAQMAPPIVSRRPLNCRLNLAGDD